MDCPDGTDASPPAGGIVPAPRSRNPVRRLYEWVLSWADGPFGGVALFALAFCESSFFPIPPDVLLIALVLGARKKAFMYAAICTIGSVAGGAAGYALGFAAAPLGKSLVVALSDEAVYMKVAEKYGENAFAAIAVAGFTPIPYKVFTVTAGIFHDHVPFSTLLLASLLSRTARFFLLAALLRLFGTAVRKFIDRYFNLLTVIFTVLLIGGFLLLAQAGDGPDSGARAKVLVLELSLPDARMREKAFQELKTLSRSLGDEKRFGYDPGLGPDANRKAIEDWTGWAEGIAAAARPQDGR